MFKVTKDILQKVYLPRPPEVHKYNYGLMLVIGGGQFYSGSPALAAMAGFRSGVDMVQILAPKRAADIIASFSPNLAVYPLKGNWLDKEDLPTLISMTESARLVAPGKTAVVIGGGLGRSEETKETVLEYLRQSKIQAVIDADGIHAVAKSCHPEAGPFASFKGRLQPTEGSRSQGETLRFAQGDSANRFLITPHSYEFFVLTGREIKSLSFEEKVKVVQEEAAKLGCVILLKGKKDIISDGKEVAINETGSSFMTVGGTGDTLAGICGSLMAQGIEPFLAAQAGAFINGKAGEIAAKKFGLGLVATDLIEAIPEVFK